MALAGAPGVALSKIAAARGLRAANLCPTYDPPQIGWVKETARADQPWKPYNDTAPSARPGQAPTLMRPMPNGSKRPVKFDGVEGEYLIDRKVGVRGQAHAVAQISSQSEALAQHRLIATWEVPNAKQRTKALRLFRKLNVTNIEVRIVTP